MSVDQKREGDAGGHQDHERKDESDPAPDQNERPASRRAEDIDKELVDRARIGWPEREVVDDHRHKQPKQEEQGHDEAEHSDRAECR